MGEIIMKYYALGIILLAVVGCTPAAKDTASFCGIWKRTFSPFDQNYALLKSLENTGEKLGMSGPAFDYLLEMFYVEQTGPAAVKVYDHSGGYQGKVEYAFGAGFVLAFSTADRDFKCKVIHERIEAEVTERETKESGTMDFSVRPVREGEIQLWTEETNNQIE
jgi:hypothetical protein